MSANAAHIVRIVDSARRPLDGELEKLYGRFIATRFVLQGLLQTLRPRWGRRRSSITPYRSCHELDDRKLFDHAPPERVLGAQSELLNMIFEYVPDDVPCN